MNLSGLLKSSIFFNSFLPTPGAPKGDYKTKQCSTKAFLQQNNIKYVQYLMLLFLIFFVFLIFNLLYNVFVLLLLIFVI